MPLWWWWISSLRWCILSLPLPPVLQKLLQSCIETISLSYMVFLTRSSVIVTSDLLVLSSLGSALWWGHARQCLLHLIQSLNVRQRELIESLRTCLDIMSLLFRIIGISI